MKKNLIVLTLVVATIIIMLFLQGCDKIPRPYLKKWVGTYDCEEINRFWTMDGETQIYTFQTTVIVTVTGDSLLTFLENRMGYSYEAEVDKNGNFFKSFGMGRGMSGNFISDSINMEIGGGMQGYSSISTYKGIKIKNK